MMFKTHQGVTEDASNEIYLRPETAQGIFVNFPNVAAHDPPQAAVRRLPGRQEPSATRSRRATSSSASASLSRWSWSSSASRATDLEWFSYWRTYCHELAAWAWASRTSTCACATTSRRSWRIYSKATTDFEYLFPFGWGELWGVADRTDFDLKAAPDDTPARAWNTSTRPRARSIIPYVIEPSLGADRAALAFLCEAYEEQALEGGDTRVVHAPASGARAVQVRRAAAAKEQAAARRPREIHDMLTQAFHGGLRRDRLHRQALSPSGRDRHADVHHRRFRHAGRPALSPCATATPWSRITCTWTSWWPTSRRKSNIKPGYSGSCQANDTDISRIKLSICARRIPKGERKALWWGDGVKPHIPKCLDICFLKCSV